MGRGNEEFWRIYQKKNNNHWFLCTCRWSIWQIRSWSRLVVQPLMEVTVTQILLKVRGLYGGYKIFQSCPEHSCKEWWTTYKDLDYDISTGDYRPLNQENIDIGESEYRNGSLSIHVTVFTTFIYDIYLRNLWHHHHFIIKIWLLLC